VGVAGPAIVDSSDVAGTTSLAPHRGHARSGSAFSKPQASQVRMGWPDSRRCYQGSAALVLLSPGRRRARPCRPRGVHEAPVLDGLTGGADDVQLEMIFKEAIA
jgi:hypothetical protein